jgi:DNA-binding NarL/FixJ family response regulator
MATAVETNRTQRPKTWGDLPPQMRVLFITGRQRTGSWLAEALAADSASKVQLDEAQGVAAGLALLQDEIFDATVVSHEPDELDAFEMIDGIRAACSQPMAIIVLGLESDQQMAALAFESGADGYICVPTTTTRTFIWQLARARERNRLIAENRRLIQHQQNRLKQEHDEADRLLKQQRALIGDLERIRLNGDSDSSIDPPAPPAISLAANEASPGLPDWLVSHYRELLRAYVVMGTGNLSDEMERLTDLLVETGASAQQAMRLHLQVLEEMVEGLGSRSARHVMNRADLLVLEVMIHLAEGYRCR